jgi:lipopolysaccharide export system permease protein
MKLLDRYIIRKFATSFLFLLGALIVIVVLVDFVEKLDEFVDKKPPLHEVIFDYYINLIPYFGNLLTPVCIYLAVIFFTSNLAQRSEIVAILSSGTSFYRLLRPYMIAALVFAGISFYLKSYMIPSATAKRIEFEYKYLRKKKVSKDKDIHKKVATDTYVYISFYNAQRKEGHHFTMEKIRNGDVIRKIHADRIIWQDSLQNWQLRKVRIRTIDGRKESLSFRAQMDTTFLLTPDDIFIKEMKAESMNLTNLIEYIRLEQMRGSDILDELYIERHRRFSDPIAILILTLIGFAMSTRKSRGGIAFQIGIGILITFLYIILLFIGQAFVGENVSPMLAVWFPNFLFFPLALFLLRIVPK